MPHEGVKYFNLLQRVKAHAYQGLVEVWMVLIRTITITLGAAVIRSGRQSVTADKQKQRV